MIQKMKKSKGFTLIEMLVVIAIIAILVAIIVPVVGNSTTKAKAAADAANLRSVATTVAVDYLDNNAFDTAVSAPACKSETSAHVEAWVVNGNIECYFVKDSAYYSVSYYSALAEGNTATAGTAPTGTGVKQIASEATDGSLAKVTS